MSYRLIQKGSGEVLLSAAADFDVLCGGVLRGAVVQHEAVLIRVYAAVLCLPRLLQTLTTRAVERCQVGLSSAEAEAPVASAAGGRVRMECGRSAGRRNPGILESTTSTPQTRCREYVCVGGLRDSSRFCRRVTLEWIPGFQDSVIIGVEGAGIWNPGILESTQTCPRRRSGLFLCADPGIHLI